MDRIVFLDRDGTINEEVEYLHRPEDLVILPGVPKALRRLREQGFKLVVVTNQAGVARGYYKEEDVKSLHEYLNSLLSKEGAFIDRFYYCPHHPVYGIGEYGRECHCRKPETGMFEMAEASYPVDKSQLFGKVFTHDSEANPDAIEVVLHRLRKKLAGSDVRIVTVRGLGYMLESVASESTES